MSNKIDSATIFSRIKLLYNELTNKKDGWNNADVFAFLYGKSDDEQPYRKGAALHRWLLGYELPESLIFLRIKDSSLSLLVPTKIKKILEVLETTPDDFPVKVKIIDFNSKDDADQKQKINQLLSSLSDDEVLGLITKDKHEGDFANNWNNLTKKFKSVDVTNGLSNVLSVKDAEQIKLVKKSGLITTSVLQKKFVPRMETIIDEEQKISHAQFSDEIEAIILDAKKNISDKLNSAMCDRCYSPIIQSGGTYDLRANAISNDDNLHFGTIICSLGVRYRSYCTNVSRTFLIDPKKDQENNYLLLLDVQKACLKQMIVGNAISKIYNAAVQLITEKNSSLLDKFVKSAGFGMGVEFREGSLIINSKNKKLIEEGMVFNLSLGFNDLLLQSEPKDKKKKNYALLISDTVIVNSNGPEIITKCKVNYSDIAYFLEEQEDEIKVTNTDSKVIEEIANSKVNTGRNDQIKNKLEEEENRKKHQKDLAEKQLRERMKAFSENNNNNSKGKESSSTQKDLVSFSSFDEFSSEINDKNHQIIVDENHESVLLPIYGTLVPFHISTIKNVSKDNDTIRINFLFPGTAANMPLLNNQALKDSQKIFIREFLFRITNTQLLNNCIVSIKALQKTTKQQDQLSDTLRSIKKQEKLILNKAGKNPALHSVFIRPSISKRTTGSIEAHKNGVRFTPVRGATPIDILYKNVRHAFFQPADKDMIVAIHFHLYDAIMVGNKKTIDIQFCTEVTEASQTTQGKRRYHDEDELEDEQREREMKARLNAEYQRFAKNLEELTGGALEFDVPYKELGFYGVPFKSNVFIQPTVNCLVQLIEPPFFVLSLSDIEICNLERVQFNLQQFDAKFILKDFSKPVVNIDNIPVQYLETLKKWLDSCNINYYSMAGTLQWKRVMQTIRDDPENFFKMGGWRAVLESDSEDEQIEEVDDGDDDYGEDEVDDDDDEYDDDDDDDSLEMESGSDASDDGSEEDESDGEDWDAMEEKLRRDDMSSKEKRKRKGRDFSDDDSEDEPKRKKKAPSAPPSRAPPRKNAPPPTRRK